MNLGFVLIGLDFWVRIWLWIDKDKQLFRKNYWNKFFII